MVVGKHIIAEFYGVSPELIARKKTVREIMNEAADRANLDVVGSIYKQFEPHGVTGVMLVSESHVSIHTWPEHGLVTLDVFTCGDPKQADVAYQVLYEKFKPKDVKKQVLERG